MNYASMNAAGFPSVGENLLRRAVEEFGLLPAGYKEERDGCLVETDEGQKYVHPLHCTMEEYCFVTKAMSYLRRRGFSRLPREGHAPDGNPAVEVDGTVFVMDDWTAGWRPDLRDRGQLTQAVEMLAWFHRCSQGYSPAGPGVRDEWGSWTVRLAKSLVELQTFKERARAGGGDEFTRSYIEYLGPALTEATGALEDLRSSPYEEVVRAGREAGGLCHRDYTDDNMVLGNDGALYLRTYENMAMDTHLDDLGSFMARYGLWDMERFSFILQTYHGVRPLAKDDIICLCAYLRFPHDFWQLAHFQYSAGISGGVLEHAESIYRARRRSLEGLLRLDPANIAGTSLLYRVVPANPPKPVPADEAVPGGGQEGDLGEMESMEGVEDHEPTAVEAAGVMEEQEEELAETAGVGGDAQPEVSERAMEEEQASEAQVEETVRALVEEGAFEEGMPAQARVLEERGVSGRRETGKTEPEVGQDYPARAEKVAAVASEKEPAPLSADETVEERHPYVPETVPAQRETVKVWKSFPKPIQKGKR